VLGTLERIVRLVLALDTLEAEHNLLSGLGLLVEDRLGLTTVTLLLTVITALTLGVERSLAGLVLGNLVDGMLLAVLRCAVGLLHLWDSHLQKPRVLRTRMPAASQAVSLQTLPSLPHLHANNIDNNETCHCRMVSQGSTLLGCPAGTLNFELGPAP